VLQKMTNKYTYDENAGEWMLTENRQEILDEKTFYNMAQVYSKKIGIRTDGTVALDGSLMQYDYAKTMASWKNVRVLVLNNTCAILNDETFVTSQQPVTDERIKAALEWRDLVDVYFLEAGIVGLRSDGLLVTYGLSDAMQKKLAGWSSIVEIAPYDGPYPTQLAALTASGEVLLSDAKPGDRPIVNKPVKHLIGDCYGSEAYVLYQDGTVGCITYGGVSLGNIANADLVDISYNLDCAIAMKSDGWLTLGVSNDLSYNEENNYYNMAVHTINIDTLEGVIVE